MNCNLPTDICFSLEGFHARGGHTGDHADGWGIGFFEGRGCRVFLDSMASTESPIADWVRRYPIHSTHVIAHIRKATQGAVTLENTHPFQRELWGQYWVFAHNGDLRDYVPEPSEHYRPVGTTDSERAFCQLLAQLRRESAQPIQPLEKLFWLLQRITTAINRHGSFNYLLSNGSALFAHCATDLYYVNRQAPFGPAHLIDKDITLDLRMRTHGNHKVILVATQPLTDNEHWVRLRAHTLLLIQDGTIVASGSTEPNRQTAREQDMASVPARRFAV